MSETASAGEHSEQTSTIVVNGQPKVVASRIVSWDEVVDFADPGQRSNPDLTFIVTYEETDESKHDGTLAVGGSVHVKKEGRSSMSRAVVDRSPDLHRLWDEHYAIRVTANNHLIVDRVPYVTPRREVAYGRLVSKVDFRQIVLLSQSASGTETVDRVGGPVDAASTGTEVTRTMTITPGRTVAAVLVICLS